jgi:hypothetical protein
LSKSADTNLWGIRAGHPVAELVAHHLLNTMGHCTRIQFNSRCKGLLPLRQVYVPEAIESDEESQEALTGRASHIAGLDGDFVALHCRRCASSLGDA